MPADRTDDTEEMATHARERERHSHERHGLALGRRGMLGTWQRMQKWQQIAALTLAGVSAIFAAGVTYQKALAAIVLVDDQKAVDDRQDVEIQAVLNDNALLHVSQEHLHDEVRGMRLDIRSFDPRVRGGGLPRLDDEDEGPPPRTTGSGR